MKAIYLLFARVSTRTIIGRYSCGGDKYIAYSWSVGSSIPYLGMYVPACTRIDIFNFLGS